MWGQNERGKKNKKFQAYINTIEKGLLYEQKQNPHQDRIRRALPGSFRQVFVISSLFGLRLLENQPQMVEWLIIYSLEYGSCWSAVPILIIW